MIVSRSSGNGGFTLRSAAAPDTISDLAGLHQESVDGNRHLWAFYGCVFWTGIVKLMAEIFVNMRLDAGKWLEPPNCKCLAAHPKGHFLWSVAEYLLLCIT